MGCQIILLADGQVVRTICLKQTGNLESSYFSVLKPKNQNIFHSPNCRTIVPNISHFSFLQSAINNTATK